MLHHRSLTQRASLLVWTTLLLALYASAGRAWGHVDDGRPDLSMFKLRRVDTRQLARSRLGKPITDLATGAAHMHESLFVESNNVKCPAYAHLFKLIKHQQQQPPIDELNVIRQNFVETLAIMITYDRILYHELFLRAAQQVSAEHFVEAIQLLEERDDGSAGSTGAPQASKQAAWFDLYQCLSHYMAGRLASPSVDKLLGDSGRKRAAAGLARFRSIPVAASIAPPVDGELAPDGLVRNLANKYEAGIMKRRMLCADEMSKANGLIGALEDATTSELKRQIAAELQARQESSVTAAAAAAAGSSSSGSPAKLAGDDADNDSELAPLPEVGPEEARVELVVPAESAVGAETTEGRAQSGREPELEPQQIQPGASEPTAALQTSSAHFREAQLAILKFIRMRLERTLTAAAADPHERVARLNMQLAFDFANHWNDLQAAAKQLDASTSLGKHALDFLQDGANAALAKRVRKAIDTYVELTQVLHYMKLQEDQYESIYDLRLPLDKLTELLNSMDASFDVDDLRRLHAIWSAKYTEYSTMDRFINSDSW